MDEDLCKTAMLYDLAVVEYVPLRYKTERFFLDLLESYQPVEADGWE